MRPRDLEEFVGQAHLVGERGPLRRSVARGHLASLLLWGPPGTGKTSLARLLANAVGAHFVSLSAVMSGVVEVRATIAEAQERLALHGARTVLFLDEIHRFNKAQQDALLPSVEDGLLVLIGATTENPFFEVNPPLLSRSSLFRLEPLGPAELTALAERGLHAEAATADADAIEHLATRAAGDGRQMLIALEVAVALAANRRPGQDPHLTLADAEDALGTRALRYGRDDHYDVVSAFIKSIRGSDPDAGLYWLARMLEAGEDARFIARRLVILASEDVGLADPVSLLVADAAARAVEFVGLPEAQLNLAQAVVHLATAPKSNRAALGIWNARAYVQTHPSGEVPMPLRDAHYKGARSLGHGAGYGYPHDDPRGWTAQRYLPEGVDETFYEPSSHGREQEIARRMRELKASAADATSHPAPRGDV